MIESSEAMLGCCAICEALCEARDPPAPDTDGVIVRVQTGERAFRCALVCTGCHAQRAGESEGERDARVTAASGLGGDQIETWCGGDDGRTYTSYYYLCGTCERPITEAQAEYTAIRPCGHSGEYIKVWGPSDSLEREEISQPPPAPTER